MVFVTMQQAYNKLSAPYSNILYATQEQHKCLTPVHLIVACSDLLISD